MKKHWGIGGIILGLLFLSAELYCLKVIQSLEKLHGTWLLNAWEYMKEPQCLIAILITIGVIIYSATLPFSQKGKYRMCLSIKKSCKRASKK